MSEMMSRYEVSESQETKAETTRAVGQTALESEGFARPTSETEQRVAISAGYKVQLEHAEGDLAWYKLLGEGIEDDPDDEVMSVSPTSPLGQRLAGMAIGDTVHWKPPHGSTQARIVQVTPPPSTLQ